MKDSMQTLRPLNLAVIFDQHILAGGGYQQALNAILLTRELAPSIATVYYFTTLRENLQTLESIGITPIFIRVTRLSRALANIRRLVRGTVLARILNRFRKFGLIEKELLNYGIDLAYATSPSSWPCDLEQINYITTVWDLSHRDDPEFPEVRWDRQFELRETKYSLLLPRATAILVDSELGKRNVVERYGVDRERVHIIPFQGGSKIREGRELSAAASINILKKYSLDVPYVFYPAQFWAHKNHIYLLEGLRELEKRYQIYIGAIFSGGDQGNLAHVQGCVRKLSLTGRVRFAGFVSNEEMTELYRQSIALVMPSYFGPTNLPPLEAFELEVPVLYSDKKGLREQVNDAALLMNLADPNSMAVHLKSLINDPQLRARLVEAGKMRLAHFDSFNRVERLESILERFRRVKMTWSE